MSYILDALRRADAERERGTVPGLHAQTVPAGSSPEAARPGINPLVWMGIGAAVVAAALLAWTMSGSDAPPAVVVAAPPAAPAAPPVPVTVSPAAPVLSPAPVVEAPPVALHKPAPAAAAAAERIYSIAELPENIRRGLPAMTIGGSIYSPTPASRFLIINGQIFHEGDKVATDLRLEEIKLKAAVLRYKTYRVGITY
ncbi:MAG TPA: general secretion pathway protein GspB [Albitalea sp.]|nr:general secretion pathway protein GspB [Albitalea sp.]